jgi:uncharacterized membrane protein YbaN (DUF454 family)
VTDAEIKPPVQGWRKYVRIASGVGLLIVGIIGLLLPVMPQWPFIIPGLMILADYYPPAKRLLDWLRKKIDAAREYMPKRAKKEDIEPR